MSEDRSRWWVALTGLTALVAVLAVLSIRMASLDTGHPVHQDTEVHLSETVMRLMLGSSG
jgi:hypothetical protein